jgi:predicted kinase
VEWSARRALLTRAATAGVPVVAVVLDLPPAVVIARNARRPGRVVDEHVVRRHLARLRASLEAADSPLDGEGFRHVIVLRDPDAVDSIRVIRRAGETA